MGIFYNDIITAKVNSFKKEFLDDFVFNFSKLPMEVQKGVIDNIRAGSERDFMFLIRGFWMFFSTKYLMMVATLGSHEFQTDMVDDDLMEIISSIHGMALRNKPNYPIGVQIAFVIPRLCAKFRKLHQFGFVPTKHLSDDEIKKRLYLKRPTISFDECWDSIKQPIYFDDSYQFDSRVDDFKNEIRPIIQKIFKTKSHIMVGIITTWVLSFIAERPITYEKLSQTYGYHSRCIKNNILKFNEALRNDPELESLFRDCCSVFRDEFESDKQERSW